MQSKGGGARTHRAGDEARDEDARAARGVEAHVEGLIRAARRARLATLAHQSLG